MENKQSKYSGVYNIILVGDIAVGKTCLVSRYFIGYFVESCYCTNGIDNKVCDYLKNKERFKIIFWETSGAYIFVSFIKQYLRKGPLGDFCSIKLWPNICKSTNYKTSFTMLLIVINVKLLIEK